MLLTIVMMLKFSHSSISVHTCRHVVVAALLDSMHASLSAHRNVMYPSVRKSDDQTGAEGRMKLKNLTARRGRMYALSLGYAGHV